MVSLAKSKRTPHNKLVARKILKSPKTSGKKIKFYFPTKISWNPFAYLDRKAKHIPKNVLTALLLFLFSFIALNGQKKATNRHVLGLQTSLRANQEEIYQWEQIIRERPDYRDGWLQLCTVYYQAGNLQKAKDALQKAKEIDPNDKLILSLEAIINANN